MSRDPLDLLLARGRELGQRGEAIYASAEPDLVPSLLETIAREQEFLLELGGEIARTRELEVVERNIMRHARQLAEGDG